MSHSEAMPHASAAAEDESARKAAKALKKQRKREREAAEALSIADGGGAAAAVVDGERPKKKKKKASKDDGSVAPAADAKDQLDGLDTVKPKKIKKSSETIKKSVPSSTDPEIASFLLEEGITYEPSSAPSAFAPLLSFDQLDLVPDLKTCLSTFSKPTPIQSASWPVLFGQRDLVGIAKTGSGKTLAFGLPAMQHILKNASPDALSSKKKSKKRKIQVLVIAPTRELAMQTSDVFEEMGKPIGVPSVCIYGGVPKPAQVALLQELKPFCIVGTPGRILDFANEGTLDLSHVDYLILDEADRMLDKGFEPDIRAIISKLKSNAAPEQASRRTAMFSATWPTSVRALADDFMVSPIRVTVGSDELTANTAVEQKVVVLQDGRQKEQELLKALRSNGFPPKTGGSAKGSQREKVIVFALYKKEASRLHSFLERQGYEAGCIQGDLGQAMRTKALDEFKTGKTMILVATDVAARGLDLPKVELVVNVTFPLQIEDYVHRIGRTGRAGRTGKSVTFFTEEDKQHAGELQRVLKDAGQQVPSELAAFGGTIKKKSHPVYGAHYDESLAGKKGSKITFD